MSAAVIAVARLPHAAGLPLPSYATEGAAGMDLLAAVSEPLLIAPGARALVPTGLRLALPPGHELQVIILNAGAEPFTVERGMRIAQAVLAPVTRAAWREVEALPESTRGAGGFGSTGTG